MLFRRAIHVSLFLLLAMVAGATVRYGMPKNDLFKELGQPTSTLSGSGREILIFPKNVRIELENGVVVGVKGLDLVEVEAATKKAADEKAAAEALARHEHEEEEKVQAALAAAETAKAKKAALPREAKSRTALPANFSWKIFLVDLALKGLLLVGFLRFATNYWRVQIGWPGLFLGAAADTGARAGLALLGVYVFHATSLFLLDQILATVVLALVLRQLSATRQTAEQAGKIAVIAKACALVVGAVVLAVIFRAEH